VGRTVLLGEPAVVCKQIFHPQNLLYLNVLPHVNVRRGVRCSIVGSYRRGPGRLGGAMRSRGERLKRGVKNGVPSASRC
jgi:hypothetical protein